MDYLVHSLVPLTLGFINPAKLTVLEGKTIILTVGINGPLKTHVLARYVASGVAITHAPITEGRGWCHVHVFMLVQSCITVFRNFKIPFIPHSEL
jgi:hypothetical protein